MRIATVATRYVTYVGSKVSFIDSFEQLVEQLEDSGVSVFHQAFPRYRVWVNGPNRQVLFISQNDWKLLQGRKNLIIPISKVGDFLKTGGTELATINNRSNRIS